MKTTLRIYVDTSAIGGFFDTVFSQQTKPLWEAFFKGQHRLVLSTLTLRELGRAPQQVQQLVKWRLFQMSEKKGFKAVAFMREVRDDLAKAEEGLTWKERKAKLHRDLKTNPLWKRFGANVRPVTSETSYR